MVKSYKSRRGVSLAQVAVATDNTDAIVAQSVEPIVTTTDVSVEVANETLDAIVATLDPIVEVDPIDPTEPTMVEVEVVQPEVVLDYVANRANAILWVNTHMNRETHWSRTGATCAGIPIPRGMGLCASAWYFFEYMFAHGTVDTATVVEVGFRDYAFNRGNLRTEISRYRKYHGIATVSSRAKSVA